MFNDWRTFRNSSPHLQSIDTDIEDLENLSKSELAAAICRFITEVKKVDGEIFHHIHCMIS